MPCCGHFKLHCLLFNVNVCLNFNPKLKYISRSLNGSQVNPIAMIQTISQRKAFQHSNSLLLYNWLDSYMLYCFSSFAFMMVQNSVKGSQRYHCCAEMELVKWGRGKQEALCFCVEANQTRATCSSTKRLNCPLQEQKHFHVSLSVHQKYLHHWSTN